MKHATCLTHLNDSQYLWYFLEIHDKAFTDYEQYKYNIDYYTEIISKDFQSKYDINILPYLYTAYTSNANIFHRFLLYLHKYIDKNIEFNNDLSNDRFICKLLETCEPYQIMATLLSFQYYFL